MMYLKNSYVPLWLSQMAGPVFRLLLHWIPHCWNEKCKFENQSGFFFFFFLVTCHFHYVSGFLKDLTNVTIKCGHPLLCSAPRKMFAFHYAFMVHHYYFSILFNFGLMVIKMTVQISEYLAGILCRYSHLENDRLPGLLSGQMLQTTQTDT